MALCTRHTPLDIAQFSELNQQETLQPTTVQTCYCVIVKIYQKNVHGVFARVH